MLQAGHASEALGATHASGVAVDLNSFGLPNVLNRTWPDATELRAFPLCRKSQVLISGGCYYVVNSALVLDMETSCSLLVGFVVCWGFFKVNLKKMILRMLTFLAQDSGFNFTWRPLLGCFSHFVSDCKFLLWSAWGSVKESWYKSSLVGYSY